MNRACPVVEVHRPAIRSVSRHEELYAGRLRQIFTDVLVNFDPGFRVSWQSALGGFAGSLLQNNMRRWSGDHNCGS